MSTPKGWPAATGMDDWMRQQEKRGAHHDRRQRISTAQDLLGPGFAPYAVEIRDWNEERARFNGFFSSAADAENAPEEGVKFLGLAIATTAGHVLQYAWSHGMDDPGPERAYTRSVHTHANQATMFGAWTPMGSPPGVVVQQVRTAPVPAGWLPCNGAIYNASDYPALAAALGATGDSFQVPDMAGGLVLRYIIRA